jgi:CheY-like chemotaxis protein
MIFITSSVEESTRLQALEEGAIAWFTKPVADAELLRALYSALGQQDHEGARG